MPKVGGTESSARHPAEVPPRLNQQYGRLHAACLHRRDHPAGGTAVNDNVVNGNVGRGARGCSDRDKATGTEPAPEE